MKVELNYSKKARKDLAGFSAKDREKILLKLEFFCFESSPMKHAKTLSGELKGLYRFRIGDYRAIFSKDSKGRLMILTIITIKHRRDVYA